MFDRGGNPKVFLGVVDDEDVLMGGGCDLPRAPEELDGVGGADAPGKVQREMEVQKFFLRSSL